MQFGGKNGREVSHVVSLKKTPCWGRGQNFQDCTIGGQARARYGKVLRPNLGQAFGRRPRKLVHAWTLSGQGGFKVLQAWGKARAWLGKLGQGPGKRGQGGFKVVQAWARPVHGWASLDKVRARVGKVGSKSCGCPNSMKLCSLPSYMMARIATKNGGKIPSLGR